MWHHGTAAWGRIPRMVEPRLVMSGPIWERLMGRTTDVEPRTPGVWTFFLVRPAERGLHYHEVRIPFDPNMSPAERFHHTAKMAVEAAFRFVAAPDGGGPCYFEAPDLVEAWPGKASQQPHPKGVAA